MASISRGWLSGKYPRSPMHELKECMSRLIVDEVLKILRERIQVLEWLECSSERLSKLFEFSRYVRKKGVCWEDLRKDR